MTDATDTLEGFIRDWLSQGTDMPTAPTDLYVALHTSDPGDTLDGSTEVGASDYDRVQTAAGTDWDTPNENDFTNANEISFGEATNDWGDISHFSLWDGADDTTNPLVATALTQTKTINSGDQVVFNAGELTVSID